MAGINNYTLALLADQEISLSVPLSDYVRCYDGQTVFSVYPENFAPLEIQNGVGVKFDNTFNTLRIKNGSTPQTVKLYIGSGDIQDNRLITQGGITFNANAIANVSVAVTGAVAASVLASNSQRSSALLVNTGTSVVYVGFSGGVTAANGFPIGVGSSINLTVQSEVFAISALASELRILEEGN